MAHAKCTGNKICPAQKKGAIVHYVSKKAMDIQGIGDKLISRLVEENLVNNISDLYKLNEKNLRSKTIKTLKSINAKLIEIPYTKNISS